MNPSIGNTTLPQSQTNPLPACPHCGNAMIRRITAHGANKGNEFWGCSLFPKCHGTIFNTHTVDVTNNHSVQAVNSAPAPSDNTSQPVGQGWWDRINAKITAVFEVIEKMWRNYLESEEPDATGVWRNPNHRRRVLRHIYNRDKHRCGLCGGEMQIKGAQIEHIVPKVFAVFNVQQNGEAIEGTHYKSLLHKLDNLQAAHSYCNKRKGNTPSVVKWRHPSMPPRGVAAAQDGKMFFLPWQASQYARK